MSCVLFGILYVSSLRSVFTNLCCFSRLPVRTLLFICAVCDHGGHQSCYREYYTRQSLVDLPSSSPQPTESRDQPSTQNQQNNEDDSNSMSSSQSNLIDPSISESPLPTHQNRKAAKLAGHPCAAGCGHICWVTNRNSED